MRQAPTASELAQFTQMDVATHLEYFITRCMECEEVWRLCDQDGWVVQQKDGKKIMALWPYAVMAEQWAQPGQTPDAVSLEYFIYHEMNALHSNDIMLNLMPIDSSPLLLSAERLFHILESKMDAEQYFIEG